MFKNKKSEYNLNKAGPGIEKNDPQKNGIALFGQIIYREFFSLIQLNLLFILFCMPIVTIPTAFCAMTRVTLSMVRDEPYFMFSDFVKSFKSNWKQGTCAGIIFTFALTISIIAVYFYSHYMESMIYILLTGLSFLLLCIALVMGFYIFPMIALVDLSLMQITRNSLILAITCVPYNFLMLIIFFVMTFVVIWFFPMSIFLLLLIWASLTNLITTFGSYYGIKKFVINKENS